VSGRVESGLVDTDDAFLGEGAVGGAVDRGRGYLDFVAVIGLEAGAVFTLSDVDSTVLAAVGAVGAVGALNTRLCVVLASV